MNRQKQLNKPDACLKNDARKVFCHPEDTEK